MSQISFHDMIKAAVAEALAEFHAVEAKVKKTKAKPAAEPTPTPDAPPAAAAPPATAMAPAVAPAAAPAAQSPVVASAPAANDPDPALFEKLKNAIITLANEYSRDTAVGILTRRGVKRASDLPKSNDVWQSVLDEVEEATAFVQAQVAKANAASLV